MVLKMTIDGISVDAILNFIKKDRDIDVLVLRGKTPVTSLMIEEYRYKKI